MRTLGKKTLLITGILACPCHMPLLLSLLATLLSGTVLGAWLSANMGLVFLTTTLYFVVALVVGVRWLVSARVAGKQEAGTTSCQAATVQPILVNAATGGKATPAASSTQTACLDQSSQHTL